MRFADPWWLLALVFLPLLALPRQKSAVYFSSLAAFDFPAAKTFRIRWSWLPTFLRMVWLGLVIVALARPQSPDVNSVVTTGGLNLAFIVDLSGSMGTIESSEGGKPIARLDHAKQFLSQLVAELERPIRKQDSVTLITAARYVEERLPLTRDRDALRVGISGLEVQLLENRTNLGDAIATATQVLHRMGGGIMLVCTDGASNVPEGMPPGEAARIAEALGIRIHTVGVGSARTTTDREGFARDENALQSIAKIGKGEFWRADSPSAANLAAANLAAAEPTLAQPVQYARWIDHFPSILASALSVLLLESLLKRIWLPILPDPSF